MKSLNIMKPIDNSVLELMDKLKDTEQFQKLQNSYSSLEEKEQSYVQAALVSIIIILPLLFLFIFYTFISSKKSDLKMKENIITNANAIIKQDSLLRRESRKALGRNFGGQGNFKSNLTSAISRAGIDTSKLKVLNMDAEELSGGIEKLSADLKFNSFSSENFFAFTRTLGISKKIKIDEIQMHKNKQSNLLDGTFKVFYFSKIPMEDL